MVTPASPSDPLVSSAENSGIVSLGGCVTMVTVLSVYEARKIVIKFACTSHIGRKTFHRIMMPKKTISVVFEVCRCNLLVIDSSVFVISGPCQEFQQSDD